ncbi:YoaK family protein [Planomicrobium sp. YIM 101495]|uniref:YoaK family protein n=1 Tax=Planomicrobium sp. YIM 101495 TaxID=2665160 RepID=UPI0012B6E76B|nr:YoaK family protein [Planomicrobium sp. YIM 101495]MTD29475.1 DUF1275 domain-containing protein [Planomicrobium sp. YIM 101495]
MGFLSGVMPSVPENNENLLYISSGLTVISSFMMGMVDAYTFMQQSGAFASAQTGNLVILSVKAFSGEWAQMLSHLWTFAGFAIGAFAGEAINERSKDKGIRSYRHYLLIRVIVLFALAFFQEQITGAVMLVILGTLAGYELTVFRKFRGTAVNNAIMSGNVKNMMNDLYHYVFNKDKGAKTRVINLAAIIFIFMLGAGVGTLLTLLHPSWALWAACIIAALAYFWMLSPATRTFE